METVKSRTGFEIPRFILGTFAYGGGTSWQDTTDDDAELTDMLRRACEAGVYGLDTAPVYGVGRSERIVGSLIAQNRENFFIQTQCAMQWRSTEGTFMYTRDGFSIYKNFAADSIRRDVEDSLKRLGTDYIDLMIMHQCPTEQEAPEAFKALNSMKEEGMIRGIGISNLVRTKDPVETLEMCCRYADIDLVQEGGSLLKQEYTRRISSECEKHSIVYQAHSSLEKGALAGKRIEGITSWTNDNRSAYKWFQPENIPALDRLQEGLADIAGRYGCGVPALCLAWLKRLGNEVSILAGTRKMEHLTGMLESLDVDISDEDAALMEELADRAVKN